MYYIGRLDFLKADGKGEKLTLMRHNFLVTCMTDRDSEYKIIYNEDKVLFVLLLLVRH